MGIFNTVFGPPNVEKLREKKDIKGLVKALKAKDKYIRFRAANVLGELGESIAVQTLIQAVKDKNDDVRCDAISSLGKIKDSSVVEPLIRALDDNNKWNQEVAMKSLGNTGDERAVGPLIKHIREDKASNALVKIGKPAVESLIKTLKDENPYVRKRAAAILGTIKDLRAVEPLIETLNDVDVFVRCTVATNLGILKDKRAIGPLIQALKDEDGSVRSNSERAIERIGEPALEVLNQALEDENQNVKKSAKNLLEKIIKSRPNDQKETEVIKSQIKAILLELPVIEEENISDCRQKMINQSKPIHPSMFLGSISETIGFVARMVQETESFILSCEGIKRVKSAFLKSGWPIKILVLEIQYEQFWNNGTSSIYSEHVMRIGEDTFEVFGSEKSAARMEVAWKK